jgi:hypothetical protein
MAQEICMFPEVLVLSKSNTLISNELFFKEEARASENFLEETLDNVGVLVIVSEEILLREYGFVTVSFSNCVEVKLIHFYIYCTDCISGHVNTQNNAHSSADIPRLMGVHEISLYDREDGI